MPYSQRWRNSIQSAKRRPGADCGSDHELLIAKFRLKLNKLGKTTRPFRYDLKHIPYDYTVEVRNKFKGVDLIDKVTEELWMKVHDIVQEAGIKTTHPKKVSILISKDQGTRKERRIIHWVAFFEGWVDFEPYRGWGDSWKHLKHHSLKASTVDSVRDWS